VYLPSVEGGRSVSTEKNDFVMFSQFMLTQLTFTPCCKRSSVYIMHHKSTCLRLKCIRLLPTGNILSARLVNRIVSSDDRFGINNASTYVL
jgi:hypothetical protein